MSQSIDGLDQRTQRDLKFVEMMEVQTKNLENKFKEVEDGHESKITRQYKVYLHSNCAFNINQQLNDVHCKCKDPTFLDHSVRQLKPPL